MDYNNPNMPPPGYGPPPQQNPMDDVTRGKTIAILSYCTLIGWIIAIAMHQGEKTKFGAYHIRQGLGLMIFWMGAVIVAMILGWIVWGLWFLIPFIHLGGLTLAILGLINASGGKTTPVPIIGAVSDKMLAGIQ